MTSKSKLVQGILIAFFTISCILIVLPFLLLVAVSLSNEKDITTYGYQLIPKHIDFAAYKYVFEHPTTILNAYKVTAIFSFSGMVLSVLFMGMCAYPLSIPGFKAKRALSFYLYFTMLFGGGLVPSYILISQYLNLDDTIWVYIIPGLISPWYVFMIRTFMQALPGEIRESVKMDGGSEFLYFFRFVIPLSKPVLAAVALFIFLAKWNDWNTSMLYINARDDLISLQYLLQRILRNLQLLRELAKEGIEIENVANETPTETVRMAMSVVVAGPALFVFPFFQKYFVKGLTVGSVKG